MSIENTTPAADDTEIQIPEDGPAHVDVELSADAASPPAPTAAPAAKTPSSDPDEGIEKLKRQLEAERQAKEAAQARARQAEAEKTRAQSETQDSHLNMVSTAIASVTQALDMGESQLADAMAQQDFARVAKIQREMSANSAKLAQLESTKADFERRPKPAATPEASDEVERLAKQVDPKSAAWLRAHPECATGRMNSKMLAAHHDAIGEGLEPASDAYFAHIETRLGFRQAERASPRDEPPADTARRAPSRTPASAPVSRSGQGAGERPGANSVRLSREEVEMAKAMKMTLQEYAQNKYELQREGQLN